MDWGEVARQAVNAHRAMQKPDELADLLDLAAASEPKVVIEIGSGHGGTLWAWSQLGADVVAVSLPHGPFAPGEPNLVEHGATVIEQDSHSLPAWLTLSDVLAGRRADLLFIDGDHSYEGVTRDVMSYAPFVRAGGFIALHDICRQERRPQVGVWRAWQELSDAMPGREIVHAPDWWGGIGLIRVGTR